MTRQLKPKLHSPGAEVAVLGSILLDVEAFESVRVLLNPDDFFDPRHQRIYRAMVALGTGIDEITVAHKLYDLGAYQPEDAAWLAHCVANTPTPFHAAYYAGIVKKYSNRRRGLNQASIIAKEGFAGKPVIVGGAEV